MPPRRFVMLTDDHVSSGVCWAIFQHTSDVAQSFNNCDVQSYDNEIQ